MSAKNSGVNVKKNSIVLLALAVSTTALITGCGQNIAGSYTGSINRTMNGMNIPAQGTVTLAYNGNSISGTEQDQYGSITLQGTETNSTSYNITGQMTNSAMNSQTLPYGYGATGYGATGYGTTGYGAPGYGTTGYGTTLPGYNPMMGTTGMTSSCSMVTGTAIISGGNGGRTLQLNLTGTATTVMPGIAASGCSVNGTLTKPN